MVLDVATLSVEPYMLFFGPSELGLSQDQVRQQMRLVQRLLADPRNQLFSKVYVFGG